jgi:hypothetical protein
MRLFIPNGQWCVPTAWRSLTRILACGGLGPFQGAYAVRPFPAWDLMNLGLWTVAGAGFVAWRFRWHN